MDDNASQGDGGGPLLCPLGGEQDRWIQVLVKEKRVAKLNVFLKEKKAAREKDCKAKCTVFLKPRWEW